MSPGLVVTLQVFVSAAVVVAVLWWMWRLPRGQEHLYGWAPPMALLSAWTGLIGLVLTLLLWRSASPDTWLVVLLLVADPAAVCAGVLVLWIYRGEQGHEQTVAMQRIQARTGIMLGLIAVAVGYWYVMTHKTPFTPVGL